MLNRPGTVLVSGATAQVGVFALPVLLEAGYSVLALSRRAPPGPGQEGAPQAGGLSWMHPESTLIPVGNGQDASPGSGSGRQLDHVDVLLSCGPVDLANQLVSACCGLRRVICISTSSVHTKQDSPDAAERTLIAGIMRAERKLSHACRERGITLVVLRPTLIYGCGLDQNISRIAQLIRRFHFFPLAGTASGLRQPVHAADLAALAFELIQARDLQSLECPVAGGSVVSYRQMVERVFTAQGLVPRTVRIAPFLLVALFKAFAWLPAFRGINAGFFRRQNLDQVFDDGPLRALVNFNPRPFEPTMADFSIPGSVRALQPG